MTVSGLKRLMICRDFHRLWINGYPIEGLWISGIQRKLTWQNLIFPLKFIHSLWKSRQIIISSAIAMAGNICPPVPPPEIINFFIEFSYLVFSSITVISGHTPKRPGKA